MTGGATRRQQAAATRSVHWGLWLNRLMVLLAAVGVTTVAGLGFNKLRLLPVEHVAITGEIEHTTPAVLQELVQTALRGGFLGTDLGELRERLESLPWIYRANVRRQWPASLEIAVIEQLPIARWGESGYLNHEGEAFSSLKNHGEQVLPLLRGREGSQRELMAHYQAFAELLAPLDLTLTELRMSELGELRARLDGGIELVIGKQDFKRRVSRFAVIYRAQLAPQAAQIVKVDMRYGNGLAVAFDATAEQVAGL